MTHADAVMRFAVLAMATAAIMAPLGLVLASRRAIEAAGRAIPRPALILALAAVLLATWGRIYADGVRLGWWDALARILTS